MADSKRVVQSTLSPTAAVFVSSLDTAITTPTKAGPAENKQDTNDLPITPAHQLTRSLPTSASNYFDLNYFKPSPPPDIPRYSTEELINYFKLTPTKKLSPLVDVLARTSIMDPNYYQGPRSTYGHREFAHDASLICATVEPSPIQTYADATGCNEGIESRDMYISQKVPMYAEKVMPGIPPKYGLEVSQGRALYVIGLPPSFTSEAFMNIFKMCGKVVCAPAIIDLESMETFRWVIMETAEQAGIVVETRNGMALPFKGKDWTVYICKAVAPGHNFVLGGNWPLSRFFVGDVPRAATTVHGHPTAPASSTALAPIPMILPAQNTTPEQVSGSETEVEDDDSPSKGKGQAAVAESASSKAVSWANIAGTVDADSKTIDLRPETKTVTAAPRLKPVGRIPHHASDRNTEPLTEQARIIFLLELPSNITLTEVSEAIREGPLHTIQFGNNADTRERFCGIIFQFARDAEAFYQVLVKERVDSTPGRFRFIVEVRRAEEPFPADNIIRMMSAPTFATRRLTIVKSRFFFIFKEAQLQALCEKEVGEGAVQVIWLYNGGNATVVFAKVADAVAVKKRLDAMRDAAEESSHFYGLQTTFSKDPCVQDIHYISDLHE